jgi:hypothetical protein
MKAHANNVAALEKLLGLCNTHGASYNPGNASIERTALTALLEEAQKSIQAVHKARGELTKAVNFRRRAFDDLPLVGTAVVSIATANGMARDHLDDLNRIRKRFRSQPFKKGTALKTGSGGQAEQPIPEGSAASTDVPVRKNRQLNFDTKVDNFAELIEFLENEPSYAPKEHEFTLEGLKEKLVALKVMNLSAQEAVTALQQARAARNEIVMNNPNGVVNTCKMVKRYFQAIFGISSEQFRPVSKIKLSSK